MKSLHKSIHFGISVQLCSLPFQKLSDYNYSVIWVFHCSFMLPYIIQKRKLDKKEMRYQHSQNKNKQQKSAALNFQI